MNKKLSLSLSLLVLTSSFSALGLTTENHAGSRSLLGAFEPKNPDPEPHKQSHSPKDAVPTPPAVDTEALSFKPELTPEELHENPFATHPLSLDELNESSSQRPGEQQDVSSATHPENPTVKANETPKPAAPVQTPTQKAAQAKMLKEEQEKDQMVRFYFEDASLENLVRYIEDLFEIKFFVDDDLNPPPAGGALLKGNKITFKTNKAMTRADAWTLFLKFLDMAGLSVVESQITGFYRITTVTNANQEVLPTFFNTSLDALPDNSLKVRYVFFLKNASLATIQNIVSKLASQFSKIDTFPDLNGLIITDKAVNIRSLMKIVQELDKEMPEAMSVLQLKKSDAADVAKLYSDLTTSEAPPGSLSRFLGQRVQPDSLYFPANVRMVVEPRTNALILLGPKKALAKIEEFITKYIDVDLDMPYSPLYIYDVQYLDASNLATLLTSVISFGSGSAAGTFGGVRNGNEYFGPMSINAEKAGNRLIIKAEERDYKKLLPIIQQMDVLQPEVAIEVLIVNVSATDTKAIGSQIHNEYPDVPFRNVNMQTSGFPTVGGPSGPVINATTGSLLGNLISLAQGGTTGDGSTYLTIGNASAGVWGIFKALQSYTETSIIANPFLLSTNNYAATVIVGTSRQVQTGSVISSQGPTASFGTLPANLTVNITPQISVDGSVQMGITVDLVDFSDATNTASGNTFEKKVQTSVAVKDREIIALGGIVENQVVDVESKLPILGDIPLLGWLFKSKQKTVTTTNILIFISPRIITIKDTESVDYYTINKAQESKEIAGEMVIPASRRDPLNRMFFGPDTETAEIDSYLNNDPNLRNTERIVTKAQKRIAKKRKQNQEIMQRKAAEAEERYPNEPAKPRSGRFRQDSKKEAAAPVAEPVAEQVVTTQPQKAKKKSSRERAGRFKKNEEAS